MSTKKETDKNKPTKEQVVALLREEFKEFSEEQIRNVLTNKKKISEGRDELLRLRQESSQNRVITRASSQKKAPAQQGLQTQSILNKRAPSPQPLQSGNIPTVETPDSPGGVSVSNKASSSKPRSNSGVGKVQQEEEKDIGTDEETKPPIPPPRPRKASSVNPADSPGTPPVEKGDGKFFTPVGSNSQPVEDAKDQGVSRRTKIDPPTVFVESPAPPSGPPPPPPAPLQPSDDSINENSEPEVLNSNTSTENQPLTTNEEQDQNQNLEEETKHDFAEISDVDSPKDTVETDTPKDTLNESFIKVEIPDEPQPPPPPNAPQADVPVASSSKDAEQAAVTGAAKPISEQPKGAAINDQRGQPQISRKRQEGLDYLRKFHPQANNYMLTSALEECNEDHFLAGRAVSLALSFPDFSMSEIVEELRIQKNSTEDARKALEAKAKAIKAGAIHSTTKVGLNSRATAQKGFINSFGNFVMKTLIPHASDWVQEVIDCLRDSDLKPVGRLDSIIATMDASNPQNPRDLSFKDDVQDLIKQLSEFLERDSPAFYWDPISWLYACGHAWTYVLFIAQNEALRRMYYEKVCTKLIILLSHSSIVPAELFKQGTVNPLKDPNRRQNIFLLTSALQDCVLPPFENSAALANFLSVLFVLYTINFQPFSWSEQLKRLKPSKPMTSMESLKDVVLAVYGAYERISQGHWPLAHAVPMDSSIIIVLTRFVIEPLNLVHLGDTIVATNSQFRWTTDGVPWQHVQSLLAYGHQQNSLHWNTCARFIGRFALMLLECNQFESFLNTLVQFGMIANTAGSIWSTFVNQILPDVLQPANIATVTIADEQHFILTKISSMLGSIRRLCDRSSNPTIGVGDAAQWIQNVNALTWDGCSLVDLARNLKRFTIGSICHAVYHHRRKSDREAIPRWVVILSLSIPAIELFYLSNTRAFLEVSPCPSPDDLVKAVIQDVVDLDGGRGVSEVFALRLVLSILGGSGTFAQQLLQMPSFINTLSQFEIRFSFSALLAANPTEVKDLFSAIGEPRTNPSQQWITQVFSILVKTCVDATSNDQTTPILTHMFLFNDFLKNRLSDSMTWAEATLIRAFVVLYIRSIGINVMCFSPEKVDYIVLRLVAANSAYSADASKDILTSFETFLYRIANEELKQIELIELISENERLAALERIQQQLAQNLAIQPAVVRKQLADFETLWARCTQYERLLRWFSTFPELPTLGEYARQYAEQLHNGQDNLILRRLRDIAADLNALLSSIPLRDQLLVENFLQPSESPILRAVFKQELLNAATSTNEISRASLALANTRDIFNAMLNSTLPWVSLRPLLPVFQEIPDLLMEIGRIQSFVLTDQTQPRQQQQQQLSRTTDAAKNITDALKLIQKLAYVRDIVNAIDHLGLVTGWETDPDIIRMVEMQPLLDGQLPRGDRHMTMADVTRRFADLETLFENVSDDRLRLIKVTYAKDNVLPLFQKNIPDAAMFENLRTRLNLYLRYDILASRLLNSVINCFSACEPFLKPAQSFKHLLQALRDVRLSPTFANDFENVHTYAGQVRTWLSGDILDDSKNARAVMRLIEATGFARVTLGRQAAQPSTLHICHQYDIKEPALVDDVANANLKVMGQDEINEYERQLKFNLQGMEGPENLSAQNALNLLKLVRTMFNIIVELEQAGHPQYQACTLEPIDAIFHLDDIERVTNHLKRIELNLKEWYSILDEFRDKSPLLLLFSPSEIGNILLLLRPIVPPRSDCQAAIAKLLNTLAPGNTSLTGSQLLLMYLRVLRPAVQIDDEKIIRSFHEGNLIDPFRRLDLSLEHLAKILNGRDGYVIPSATLTTNVGVTRDRFRLGAAIADANANNTQHNQWLVKLSHEKDAASAGLLTLLHLYQERQRLPYAWELLWCSNSLTVSDLRLFFKRVKKWPTAMFAIVYVDQLDFSLQQILLQESQLLVQGSSGHGDLFLLTTELLTALAATPWLRQRPVSTNFAQEDATVLRARFQLKGTLDVRPTLITVSGESCSGKSYYINRKYVDTVEGQVIRYTINSVFDRLELSRKLLPLTVRSDQQNVVYLNVSSESPMEAVSTFLCELFILGLVRVESNGLVCALPSQGINNSWKIVLEIPHQYSQALLMAQVLATKHEIVNDKTHPYEVEPEDAIVFSLLDAYDRKIALLTNHIYNEGAEPSLPDTPNAARCQALLTNQLQKLSTALKQPVNRLDATKIVRQLRRRMPFFSSVYFKYNTGRGDLGKCLAEQMLLEVHELTRPLFPVGVQNPLPAYLVYATIEHVPKIITSNWRNVPPPLIRALQVKEADKTSIDDYNSCLELLSWALNIYPVERVETVLTELKFVLIPDYVFRLVFIHERKLTALAALLESDTGVGKTFLLDVYSHLLNQQMLYDRESADAPRLLSRLHVWLLTWLRGRPVDDQVAQAILAEHQAHLQNETYSLNILVDIIRRVAQQLTDAVQQSFVTAVCALPQEWYQTYAILQRSEPVETQLNLLHNAEGLDTVEAKMAKASECIQLVAGLSMRETFFRLLIHPGISEDFMLTFMAPIIELALQVPRIVLVVFFDEVNTASILSLFKEMLVDHSLQGIPMPKNIFFVAAINPFNKKMTKDGQELQEETVGADTIQAQPQVFNAEFNVHELPPALKQLRLKYEALTGEMLHQYIRTKIDMVRNEIGGSLLLDPYTVSLLTNLLEFCHEYYNSFVGPNAVSQRDLQRTFKIVNFIATKLFSEKDHQTNKQSVLRDSVVCAVALVYHLRLPESHSNDGMQVPSRQHFSAELNQSLPTMYNFTDEFHHILSRFIKPDNFVFPSGIALNQALLENIFSILVAINTNVPLGIIGAPGSSKTLSIHIVLQNLRGATSTKEFCRGLPPVDRFFCQCSENSLPEDISRVLDDAIKRQEQYISSKDDRRCVVLMDEAGLPNTKRMVLKVLHPYLDECKVAFVAISNRAFDPANANRMMQVLRSVSTMEDLRILALGCLDLPPSPENNAFADGLSAGYTKTVADPDFGQRFHYRDFIYTLRHIQRYASVDNTWFKPSRLLEALERNFNGISDARFRDLVRIFFESVAFYTKRTYDLSQCTFRSSVELLREALDPSGKNSAPKAGTTGPIPAQINRPNSRDKLSLARIRPRFKLVIDPSGDDSGARLLLDFDLLKAEDTEVIYMSEFEGDNHELYHVEQLSLLKNCMETGRRVFMVRTAPLHGSLYDVFNQNFTTLLSNQDSDKDSIYSMIAIGSRTYDCLVHPNFECIVHLRESEVKNMPAPFLSRFEKYELRTMDFYELNLQQFLPAEQQYIEEVRRRCEQFFDHIKATNFYGCGSSQQMTVISLLISHMRMKGNPIFDAHAFFSSKALRDHLESGSNNDRVLIATRALCTQLMQILPPEATIARLLPAITNGRFYAQAYFNEQHHFNLVTFLQAQKDQLLLLQSQGTFKSMKIVMHVRASANSLSLSQTTSQWPPTLTELTMLVDADACHTQHNFMEKLDAFVNSAQHRVLCIIINATGSRKAVGRVSQIRQLIDDAATRVESRWRHEPRPKIFSLLLAFPPETLYTSSGYPTIFLRGWDFHFFDTISSVGEPHIRRFVETLLSSPQPHDNNSQSKAFDTSFGADDTEEAVDEKSFNNILRDVLLEYCTNFGKSPIPRQIKDMLADEVVQFYSPENKQLLKRVDFLESILNKVPSIRARLLGVFHSLFKRSAVFKLIHNRAEKILRGDGYQGLSDQVFFKMRNSFQGFLEILLHEICSDYGLQPVHHQITNNRAHIIERVLVFLPLPQQVDVLATFAPSHGASGATAQVSIVHRVPLFKLIHNRLLRLIRTGRERHLAGKSNGGNNIRTLVTQVMQEIAGDADLVTFFDNMDENNPFVQDYLNDIIVPWVRANSNVADVVIPVISRWLSLTASSQLSLPTTDQRVPKSLQLLALVCIITENERAKLLTLLAASQLLVESDVQKLVETDYADNLQLEALKKAYHRLWVRFKRLVEQTPTPIPALAAWMNEFAFTTNHFALGEALDHNMETIRLKISAMKLAQQFWLLESKLKPHVLLGLLQSLVKSVPIDLGNEIEAAVLDNYANLPDLDNDNDNDSDGRTPLPAAEAANVDNNAQAQPALVPRDIDLYYDNAIQMHEVTTLMRDFEASSESISFMWLWFLRSATAPAINLPENCSAVLDHIHKSSSAVMPLPMARSLLDLLHAALDHDSLADAVAEQIALNVPPQHDTKIYYFPPFYNEDNERASSFLPLQSYLADAYFAWSIASVPVPRIQEMGDNISSKLKTYYEHFVNLLPALQPRATVPRLIRRALDRAVAQHHVIMSLAEYICSLPEDAAQMKRVIEQNRVGPLLTGLCTTLIQNSNARAQLLAALAKIRDETFVLRLLTTPSRLQSLESLLGSATNTVWLARLCNDAAESLAAQAPDAVIVDKAGYLSFMTDLVPANNNNANNAAAEFVDNEAPAPAPVAAPAAPAEPVIWAHLYQMHSEMKVLLSAAAANGQFIPLLEWCGAQITQHNMAACECHMLLVLCVYHYYYDLDRLAQLRPLLILLKQAPVPASVVGLELTQEARQVLLLFLEPQSNMTEFNQVGNDITANFQVGNAHLLQESRHQRHILVNLVALVLGTGTRDHHLWTHVFKPQTLRGTFGFSSAYQYEIGHIHYDCGCVIREDGTVRVAGGFDDYMAVPVVYLGMIHAYAAIVMSLLIDKSGAIHNALRGPVFTPEHIDATPGQTPVSHLMHFLYHRVGSSWVWLTAGRSLDDMTLLVNTSLERYAWLCRDGPSRRPEFRPSYTTLQAKVAAENTFAREVYFHSVNSLAEVRARRQHVNQIGVQIALFSEAIATYPQLPPRNTFTIAFTQSLTAAHVRDQHSVDILRRFFDARTQLHLLDKVPAIFEFYELLHRSLPGLVTYDEALNNPLSFFIDESKMRLDKPFATVRQIVNDGIKAFNDVHKALNGIIQLGPCPERQDFTKILFDNTSLIYLLSDPDDENVNDVLFKVLGALANIANTFFRSCLHAKLRSKTDSTRALLLSAIRHAMDHDVNLLQATVNTFARQLLLRGDIESAQKSSRSFPALIEALRQDDNNFSLLRIQHVVLAEYVLGRRQLQVENDIRRPFLYRNANRIANVQKQGVPPVELDAAAATAESDRKDELPQELILNHPQYAEKPPVEFEALLLRIDGLSEDELLGAQSDLYAAAQLLNTLPETELPLNERPVSMLLEVECRRPQASWCPKDWPIAYLPALYARVCSNIANESHLFKSVAAMLREPLPPAVATPMRAAIDRVLADESPEQLLTTTINNLIQLQDSALHNAGNSPDHSMKGFFDFMRVDDVLVQAMPETLLDIHFVAFAQELLNRRRYLLQRDADAAADPDVPLWDERCGVPKTRRDNEFYQLLKEQAVPANEPNAQDNQNAEQNVNANPQAVQPEQAPIVFGASFAADLLAAPQSNDLDNNMDADNGQPVVEEVPATNEVAGDPTTELMIDVKPVVTLTITQKKKSFSIRSQVQDRFARCDASPNETLSDIAQTLMAKTKLTLDLCWLETDLYTVLSDDSRVSECVEGTRSFWLVKKAHTGFIDLTVPHRREDSDKIHVSLWTDIAKVVSAHVRQKYNFDLTEAILLDENDQPLSLVKPTLIGNTGIELDDFGDWNVALRLTSADWVDETETDYVVDKEPDDDDDDEADFVDDQDNNIIVHQDADYVEDDDPDGENVDNTQDVNHVLDADDEDADYVEDVADAEYVEDVADTEYVEDVADDEYVEDVANAEYVEDAQDREEEQEDEDKQSQSQAFPYEQLEKDDKFLEFDRMYTKGELPSSSFTPNYNLPPPQQPTKERVIEQPVTVASGFSLTLPSVGPWQDDWSETVDEIKSEQIELIKSLGIDVKSITRRQLKNEHTLALLCQLRSTILDADPSCSAKLEPLFVRGLTLPTNDHIWIWYLISLLSKAIESSNLSTTPVLDLLNIALNNTSVPLSNVSKAYALILQSDANANSLASQGIDIHAIAMKGLVLSQTPGDHAWVWTFLSALTLLVQKSLVTPVEAAKLMAMAVEKNKGLKSAAITLMKDETNENKQKQFVEDNVSVLLEED